MFGFMYMWWFWLAMMLIFFMPVGYGWGYRGWGAPYPSLLCPRAGAWAEEILDDERFDI
jgi:hypothetical protein